VGRKQLHTPRSRVCAALRHLWLRSRERSAAIKREGNCCEACGVKGGKRDGQEIVIHAHHVDGVEWEDILDNIYAHLLVNPERISVLCSTCHAVQHEPPK
jgi:predicted HNH restriction endonuclease